MIKIGERTMANGLRLLLVHGDITEQRVDAIVNAANEALQHGGGVAAAIRRKGGPSIQAESDAWVAEHGRASHDRPALTTAGDLPSRLVIHAVGPRWGAGDEHAKLHRAVSTSLELAEREGLTSLAMPAISTGIFGFPKQEAAEVILRAIEEFDKANPDSSVQEIRLTLFDDATLMPFQQALERRWPESDSAA
ncbi:MAG: macro domain-containing protein [Anaerolineales bacterium]